MIQIDLCPDLVGVMESVGSGTLSCNDSILIYYYPDVFDMFEFEEFYDYDSFQAYCDSNGLVIPDSLEMRMCLMPELHCSSVDLNGFGIPSVIGAESYSSLLDLVSK